MWKQAHDAYMESRILTADPMELVRLTYQAAIREVRTARERLQERDIQGRAAAIGKACELLTELTRALDRQNGGEYADRLAELYAYMMRKLSDANFTQTEGPLTEVLGLLTTVLEGWEGAQQQLRQAGPGTESTGGAESPAALTQFAEAAFLHAQETGYAPRAWSF